MSTPAAPLRTLRVAAAYLVRGVARGGCERVEERGARVVSRFIFHHWYKRDPKRHSRRAHARSYHLNTHTARLNEAPEGRAGPAVDLIGLDGSLRRSMRSCEEAHFRLLSAAECDRLTWNRRRGESQQAAAGKPRLRCSAAMTSWRQPRAAWPGRQASSRHAERARARRSR